MTELEKKLKAALEAADKAFEAGYPVKAHRIVQGALTLIANQPGTAACLVCRKHGCHDAGHKLVRQVHDDAMNH